MSAETDVEAAWLMAGGGPDTESQIARLRREITSLRTENERLTIENARLIEDRMQFPQKPDDVGRMIAAHVGNLKAGKEAADRHATDAFMRLNASAIENERLREALRTQFLCVFIDGRNEHGSHVLQMPGDRIFDTGAMNDLLATIADQDVGFAEQIIADAEAMGHEVGHVVATMWACTSDPELGFEWQYSGISHELTAAMYGTPEEQRADLSPSEGHRS